MKDIIARLLSFLPIIRKGKKYLKPGQKPPKGVVTHRGPHDGTYYFVEDRHVKQGGKEHELVRSRGVTKDQFKTIEEKYKSLGAESVHFVHVPGLEKNQKGENLYNIYVNWGEKTQKKISDKKAADKARYGHPRVKDTEQESKESKEALKDVPELGTDPVQEYHDTKSRLLSLSTEGKVPEIEAHEEALQKRKGDTPVKDFMAGMLKRHYPDAGEDQIQEAARHALVKHTRAIADKVKTPLSDAFVSGRNWLENLKHQKIPDRITPATPKKTETPTPVKTSSQKPAAAKPVRKVRTTQPKLEPGFRKESDHGNPEHAERARKRLEAKGKEAIVQHKAYANGTDKYTVYSRNKQQPKPEVTKPSSGITIPVKQGLRTWLRKITGYVPGQTYKNIGDFINPDTSTGNENHYSSLPDGIYHGNVGTRNQNPEGEKYYHVKDGQVTEIPEGHRFEYIKKYLPQISESDVLYHNAKQQLNTISKPEASSGQPSIYTEPPAKFEKRGDLILSNINPGLKNNLFNYGYRYDEKRDEYRMPAYDSVTLNNALAAAKKFGFNPMFQSHADKYSEEEEWKKTGMPVKPRTETKTFTISGDTFTHKDAIKRAGGQYNGDKTWQLKDRSGAVEGLKDLPGLKIDEYKPKKIESKPVPKLTEKEIHDEIAKLREDYLTTEINMDISDTKQYLKRFREAGGKGATA